MKKRFPIILLSFVVFVGAAWYFALAAPEKKLAIGEVPADKKSPDQMQLITFKVNNIAFRMPMYFTETWGPKGDSAKLRNVYYGQCIKRIDGRCGSPANHDPEISNFDVYLHNKSFSPEMIELNKQSLHGCETPEVLAARSGVLLKTSPVRWGMFCNVWFDYHAMTVEIRFNSANFPRFETGKMIDHVTSFLDKYRIKSKE